MPELDNYGMANYDDYRNHRNYSYKSGVLILPCADGNPVTSEVHQGYSVVKQNFAASKKGIPPLLPIADSNETVLTYNMSLGLPIPCQSGADGVGWLYSAVGEYTALETVPSDTNNGYNYPAWPFRIEPMDTIAEQNENSLSTFSLQNASSQWNQGFTLTSAFFSADI